ncbi:MAG: TetR/AcrR family transcriptional regulator [Gammaproteobacteria bacterium]|nr:TetR/AcrR family transcriptional regulator [Gammaproteobacteria bacterium]
MSTRDKIVTAAVELFIKQGISKTTTKEIAASASVAEGSIYRYFPSKEQLAWQVFKEYHQYLATQLQLSVAKDNQLKDKIHSLVSCFLKLADDDWLMFSYYVTSQHTHMKNVSKGMLTPYQVIYQIIEEGIEEGEIKTTEKNIFTAMVMGAVHQIAINKIYLRISGDLYPQCELVSETIVNMTMIKGSDHE